MYTCDGLSLTEVLVSLTIATSASLAFIQQQVHVSQFMHQINYRNDLMLQLDNASEQYLAHQNVHVDDSFSLSSRVNQSSIVFTISGKENTVSIQRRLVNHEGL